MLPSRWAIAVIRVSCRNYKRWLRNQIQWSQSTRSGHSENLQTNRAKQVPGKAHCVKVLKSYAPEQTAPMDPSTSAFPISFGCTHCRTDKRNLDWPDQRHC